MAIETLESRTLLAALPTLTALSVSASSVTSGQPVTFTAHVSVPSSASFMPSGGTVTFTDGATVLGAAPLVNGTASLVNSLFAVGGHSVRASYSGNGAAWAGSVAAAASPNIAVAAVGNGGPSGYAVPMYASASTLAREGGVGPMDSTASPTGMTPTQICHAYGFNAVSFGSTAANGAGTTIAVVDAYNDPNVAGDLHQFDQNVDPQSGPLPDPPSFTIVNQTGGATLPATNDGWATEIALDVEWSHAVAPGANILLVEANSDSLSDLMTAVNYASRISGVVAVSMSWGSSEWLGETAYDSYFTTPGVTFLVASGDSGAPPSYPSASPYVVTVGGTSLYLTSQNAYSSETGWGTSYGSSGGGVSAYESQPAYQKGVVTQSSSYRTTPDVSYDADPGTGFPVYDTLNNPASAPWGQWGGTSDAAPQWAALIAIADQGRALAHVNSLSGRTQVLPALYSLQAADFHDIITGASYGNPSYSAGPGYDLVTGLGTPEANLLVPGLVGLSGVETTLTVSPSSGSIPYGHSVTFTATVAADSGSSAPTAGSVDFCDITSNQDLGAGTLEKSTGTTSAWTLTTGAKAFDVTDGDTILASYTPGAGFVGSIGTTNETVAARAITVTAVSSAKVYDGTTSSTAAPTITSGSLVSGDTAAFTDVFTTRNVGTGKTLTVAGSVDDGNGGNNYAVSIVNDTTGLITARAITVAAVSCTKAYDGTTASSAIPTISSGSLGSGDTAAFIETYDTAALGTGKTLTPAGSVSDGNGGNNYTVAFVTSTSGTIIAQSNSTSLVWSGPGSALSLTDNSPAATATIVVSEPSTNSNLLKIDLGEGNVFASGSTTAATGLTYQNPGSPTTSQYATIDISEPENVSSLAATLPGDPLVLGPIPDLDGGVGSLTASAGSIEVAGIDTFSANGNVVLTASGNLTVDPGASILTGTGTISLAADVNADGTGDDGVGTLSIGAGAVVDSTNTSASAITLRGADINIDTSADPALVGAQRTVSTTPTTTLRGLNFPDGPGGLAFDSSGNLYVANTGGTTVSKFALGATTPTATLSGVSGPYALALDASGDLYVANYANGGTTVSEFNPGATTPTATLTGVLAPDGLAFGPTGDLYVSNSSKPGSVSEFAPGATTRNALLTGVVYPAAVAFDGSGNLYVPNWGGTTVSEFAPGATTPTTTLTGLLNPDAEVFSPSGKLYVANDDQGSGTTVCEFDPGATTPTATLTGLTDPVALACDTHGNLFVANWPGTTVSEFAPGATTPTATLTGLDVPTAVAFDGSGNLYVANSGNNTVSEFALNVTPTAGGVVVRSSLPSRSMSIGGTDNAVDGINLTDAELAQIYTTASGRITFGDSSQTGNVTFTTATPATTSGASTMVLQSPSGPGQIILDDAGVGTGLNGNGGSVALTPGSGGIVVRLSTAGVPLATRGFSATGLTLTPTVAFWPTLGTQLTLINNTATPAASHPILGTFANLPQGGTIAATYAGTTYWFQANYAGGDGNDLVLTAISATAVTTITTLSTSQPSVTYGTPVTFTATVSAQAGSAPLAAGSVDFFDATTGHDMGAGALGSSTGTTSTWTLATGVKTFNATTGDTITATYTPTTGTDFVGSIGTTTEMVTARAITVTAFSGSKGYDGTTSSTATPTITAGSLVSGDTAVFTEVFATRNVGSGVTLAVVGSVNDGNDGNNYAVNVVNATGQITARAITVTAATSTKGYDGTTSSTAVPAITSGSLATGDAAVFTEGFAARNVGAGATLAVAGSVSDGNGGNNYAVAIVNNTMGLITVRAITVTAVTATKTYDGTTSSTATPAITAGSLAAGDTAAFTESYDTAAAGTGKTLAPAGSVNDGNGGNNYAVAIVSNASGTIISPSTTPALIWSGPGGVLDLTENTPGATETIVISEPSPGVSLLKIDLGAGYVFAYGSTTSATGLTYQNSGSPTTSQYATIDISERQNVSLLAATLPGDYLTLGPIRDANGGLGGITASAGTVEVVGISTASVNGNVNLEATGNLTVAAGAAIQTGTGTISLAADVNANGTGDDGAGTLSIGAGATVVSTNSTANAITLRGADINIATSANPAVIGAQRSLSTSPTATLTGLNGPSALAFDGSGRLYVANTGNSTVSEFAVGGTTPIATLTGLLSPGTMAFDPNGNLYVTNGIDPGTVSEFAPGSTTPTATLTGLDYPYPLAFDSSGRLYVASSGNSTVSEFAVGATTPSVTLTGLDWPVALAFDPSGNLYAANANNNTVSEFAAGATKPTATLTGLDDPHALAFDASGNLCVANPDNNTVSEFAAGATTPTATLVGLSGPWPLAFDPSGNLYVCSRGNNTVSEFRGIAPTAGGVVVRSSLPASPMSIGGTDNAVDGINLTDAELAQIYTTASGTVTFGDSSQTGNVTFTTATPATTQGASTVVLQSPSGPGQIILDDAGSGTGLNGNGGTVTLTPGSGGIVMPLSAAGVPLATQGFNAAGLTLSLSLNFTPVLGTHLTLINDTAAPAASHPITGTFANLPQGGTISATYGATTYWLQANYAGGDGNDLVLTATTSTTNTTTTTLSSSQASVTYGTPVTFTATVSAQSGSTAPTAGSVDFFDATTSTDLGLGAFGASAGTTSTWTLATGVKTFNATAGDTITATYTAGTGFAGSSGTMTETVTALPITVSGITAANKVYNANTVATLTTTGAVLVGVYSGDTVTLNAGGAVGTFATKDVAQNIAVSVTGLTIGGAQAGDYTLTQPATTANIAARAITVTAVAATKTYDGTTASTAVSVVIGGSLATGDTAAFNESFDNRNTGSGKTLTPGGSVNDGNGGNNYAVTGADISGLITARAITVTATSATKTYDGTASSTAVPTITGGSLATGDVVAFSEYYSDPNVGTGKTLTAAGSVNDGNSGNNYQVTIDTDTTGAITQTVSHLVVTAIPTGITAGNNIVLVVTAVDPSGNVVTGYAGTVQFTSSDPLEPVPAANLTFTAGSGVAYAVATLETAGSWAITASDGNYTGTSAPVAVTVASAAKVVFSQPLTGAPAGATIPVTADVEDQYGNLVSSGSSSTANVTLAIASGLSGAKLLGTTTVAAVGGVATFSNLSIQQAGNYALIASVVGPFGTATTTSNSFNVTAATASQLAFTTQPVNTPGVHTLADVKVTVEDQYGNTVTTDSSSVTLSLNAAASGGGGVLKGTVAASASGGVATFNGLSIVDPSNNNYSAAGTGYTLWASDGSLTLAKSTAFNTTLIVTSCTMTPTGFVATFSQPFEVATTPVTIGPNLYSAAASNNLPVNVSLIGSTEGTERGSLVVNSTNTQITFVATTLVHSTGLPIASVSSPDATSGILAPDGYTVVLDSTDTSFVTTNGQLLDGTDSGVGGSNFNQFTAVDNSADVDVVIPSFARGPSSSTVTSTVNVLNASTPIFAGSAMSIASSAKNGATESGNTVTITTSSVHGLVAGQTVLIAGFSGAYSGYNGTFTVASVPSTTTFTYTDSTTGLSKSGSGTVTGYGLSESGHTVTVWTTVAHDLTVNEPVTISGAGVTGYNGTFTVTSLPGGANGTTFTYTDATAGLANSGDGMAALTRGIPISLIGPSSGVRSGTFTLTYSSSDLTISGAVVDPNLAASYGATLSLDASSTPGNAIIDFSTTAALPSASSTPILLGGLTATVPSTAYYKAKDLLHFSSVTLKAGGSSVATIGTDALHLVAFPGDASGDGTITSADALDMARVVAGADAGFASYPLIDPDIIGDLEGDGAVDGPNGALLGRYINGATTPQMPVYPGAPVNKLSVVGSTVSIPSASQLGTDGSVTAPITVADTALPVLPALTTSVVAGSVAAVSAGATVKDAGGVWLCSRASAVPARVPQHAADGLFTALGGTVDAAELAIVGSGADAAVGEALTAQMSGGGSAQANLDRFLWESEDSSWQDGERDWLS